MPVRRRSPGKLGTGRSVDADHDPPGTLHDGGRLVHEDDRAVRVPENLRGDRAEHGAHEGAMTAATDDDGISGSGEPDQPARGAVNGTRGRDVQ